MVRISDCFYKSIFLISFLKNVKKSENMFEKERRIRVYRDLRIIYIMQKYVI